MGKPYRFFYNPMWLNARYISAKKSAALLDISLR